MHDLAAFVLAAHTTQHARLGALVTEASQLDALQACGLPGDGGALMERRRGDLAHEALALLVRWSRLGGSIGLAHALVAVDDEGSVDDVDTPAWQTRRVVELRARLLSGGDCDPSKAIPENPDALPALGRDFDNDDAEEPPECFMEFVGLDDDEDDADEVAAPSPEAVAWHAEQRARTTIMPFEVSLELLVPTAGHEETPTPAVDAAIHGAEGGAAAVRLMSTARLPVASVPTAPLAAPRSVGRPASLESVGDLAALWGGASRKKGDTSHFARLAPSAPYPAKATAAPKPPPPVARPSVAETVPLEEDDDPPTDEAPPSVPADWPGFAHTRGKRALMVGGDPREPNRLRLAGAFGFAELEWFPAEFSRNSLQRARDRVRSGCWDMVILLSRFVGHDADNVIQPACKLHQVPFVPVQTGYGVTGVRRAIERHVLGVRAG